MKKATLTLSIFLSSIVFTSFTKSSYPEKSTAKSTNTCIVWCSWKPELGNIATVSISDCCSDDYATNVSPSNGYVGIIDYSSESVEILTHVGNSHPAGIITIKRNGATVHTHSLAANENTPCSQFYNNIVCFDNFQVLWQ